MKINQKIESELKPYTQSHCSFCDNFPIRGNEDSLDHFKPKSIEAHYELVCQWENLYYSCTNCQSTRKEQYSNLLLRPDALTYDFSSYFVYNYTTHEIDIKEGASKAIQQKAKYTRDKFGLNDIGNVKARELWYEKYFYAIALNLEPDIDTYPFRFMFD